MLRRRLHLTLAAVLSLPMTACTFGYEDPMRATTTLTEHTDHIPGSALEVRTRNGRVEVYAAPDRTDVTIEASPRARGATQEEADRRLKEITLSISREAGQRLVVKPIFPQPIKRGDGASFVIRVPDADGVHVNTGNGSIVVEGLAGDLVADTSNGAIRVRDHNGPIEVGSSNGSLRLENVNGPVRGDTSNGGITLTLAAEQEGPLHLDTSNGSISVTVGPGFAGSVKMDTSNGAVTVRDNSGRIRYQQISRSKGRVVVGDGKASSRLDTSNGAIRFTVEG